MFCLMTFIILVHGYLKGDLGRVQSATGVTLYTFASCGSTNALILERRGRGSYCLCVASTHFKTHFSLTSSLDLVQRLVKVAGGFTLRRLNSTSIKLALEP